MSLIIIHEALAFALFYSCFCRAVKTDSTTRLSILLAFWFLSIASVLCIFAPLVLKWNPDIVSLTLLFSTVFVQVVSSHHWRHGVPDAFNGDIINVEKLE